MFYINQTENYCFSQSFMSIIVYRIIHMFKSRNSYSFKTSMIVVYHYYIYMPCLLITYFSRPRKVSSSKLQKRILDKYDKSEPPPEGKDRNSELIIVPCSSGITATGSSGHFVFTIYSYFSLHFFHPSFRACCFGNHFCFSGFWN